MPYNIARLISFVFHPLLMATYLFAIFSFLFPAAFDPIKEDGTGRFIFLLFCVTFVLPVLMVSFLKTVGILQDFTMPERRQRILPFLMIAIFYSSVTYVFYSKAEVSLNDNFLKFLLVINALVLVSTLVTLFYKVSVHSIGIWGLVGILFPLNTIVDTNALLYPAIVAVVIAGVVMSARLRMQVHSLREVAVGSVLGLATSIIVMQALFRF